MKYCVVLTLLLLQGCAQMFPARVSDMGSGVFMLQTSGNMFASDESMQEKIDNKAEILCKGKGFEVLQDKPQLNQQTSTYNGTNISVGYKILNRTIRCNQH